MSERIRKMPCSVCFKPPPSETHHWKTRGSGGGDEESNLVSLCREHHQEFHDRGRITFQENYLATINQFRALMKLPRLEPFKVLARVWRSQE